MFNDGIRIQSKPSEEGGSCWVVRNSRFVNPCREFPSPEAAYEEHSAMIHKWGQRSKLPTQHPYRNP